VPAIIRWPGHVKPATVENEIFSGMDWYPTFVAAAGNPNITEQLLKGEATAERLPHSSGICEASLASPRVRTQKT
jgi:arylsulfatase A-like enzyme